MRVELKIKQFITIPILLAIIGGAFVIAGVILVNTRGRRFMR